jgi:hypothetical protein
MLTYNASVGEGQANGTQATLERVVLKYGQKTKQVQICGNGNITVPAVTASQVSHLVLRHNNNRIQPPLFYVEPKQHNMTVNMLKPHIMQVKGNEREKLKMKATQVQVVVNNATTGHKLQGSGVDNLFVHDWSYVTNWVYVMLSRVRTRGGLYCRKPISNDIRKYAVPESLKKMIRNFSTLRSPNYWTDDEYDSLFNIG